MRKKLLILLVMILFTFTACNTGSKKSNEPEEAEKTVETEETVEIEATVETEETITGYSKGILKEDGWESEWIGLRFIAPEDMVMSTQEELDELMGFTTEVLSGDFSEAQMKYVEMTTVQEMMCFSADAITNTMVAVEKLPRQMEMDSYIAALENTMSKVSELTFSIVSGDEVVSVGGNEFRKVKCMATYEGIDIHQDYFLRMKDDRIISIICTYLDESLCEKMIGGYEAY